VGGLVWSNRLIDESWLELPFLRAALSGSRFYWVSHPVSCRSGYRGSHPYRRICSCAASIICWTNFLAISEDHQQRENPN
jgi:hypothetical protein